MTLLLAALLLVAQDTTVSSTRGDLILQGAVIDATSALIPGAVVPLRGQDGMLWMSINESGKYSFQGLKPGRYQIQADLPGFERGSQKVELNVSTTVDITLGLPAISTGGGVFVSVPLSEISEVSDLSTRRRYTSWVSDLPPWFAVRRAVHVFWERSTRRLASKTANGYREIQHGGNLRFGRSGCRLLS